MRCAERWDLVVSDYRVRKLDALAALEAVRQHDRDVPFLVLSDESERRRGGAMKAGVQDVLRKDNPTLLLPAVRRELGEAQVRRSAARRRNRVATRRRSRHGWRARVTS